MFIFNNDLINQFGRLPTPGQYKCSDYTSAVNARGGHGRQR